MKKTLMILIMCAAAAVLFIYCTPDGLGLTNDSAAYIGGARSILAGQGYSRIGGDKLPRPITQFPPMYSLCIAFFSRLTRLDPIDAAKWVNLLCVILNQALFMGLIGKLSTSDWAEFFGGLAFLCAGPVLQAHIHGLSEVLYLTIWFLILHAAFDAVQINAPSPVCLLIGLLCGILMLTRYAAVSVLAALIVYFLCVLPDAGSRIRASLLTVAGFMVPFGIWLLYNRSRSDGSAVNRAVAFHLPAMDKLDEGILNFAGFFLPEYGGLIEKNLHKWGILILAGLFLLLVVTVIIGLNGLTRQGRTFTSGFLPLIMASGYIVMLILDAMFIDGSTVFDNRMLLPFYVAILLFLFVCCGKVLRFDQREPHRQSYFRVREAQQFPLWVRILVFLFMIGFPLLLVEDETDLIQEYHRNGQGFAGAEWRESETRAAALQLPKEKTFFSNRQTYLGLMNDQPSFILPPMFNAANFAERDSFEADRQWMQREVITGEAYVIVFNYPQMMEDPDDRLWLDTVLEGCPLYGLYADGAIFGEPL